MNKSYYLESKKTWQFISFFTLLLYLSPFILYPQSINLLLFDNLDSNVIWLKILAESGMIFAPNDTIIPNMMSGLPRVSYGSEFNILLWLYYLFTPSTAYVINEVAIHIVAFFSMFIFLKSYLIDDNLPQSNVLLYFTSLVFSLQALWPSAGLSIAVLPLVTYIFANIYNNRSSKLQWILLILLPLYTSFILVYIFYLGFLTIFIFTDSIKNKKIHTNLLIALTLMTTAYLLVEYRLILSMFFENNFISHRTEFNIFFTKDIIDVMDNFKRFFLYGHETHLNILQMPFILPLIIFSLLSTLFKTKISIRESILIFILFFTTTLLGFWTEFLLTSYSIPIIITVILFIGYKNNYLDRLSITILTILLFSAFYSFTFYKGFDFIIELFPIFKSFSLARASFILPFLYSIATVLSLKILYEKYNFSTIAIIIILIFQINHSINNSFFSTKEVKAYSSFQNYYAPSLFDRVKDSIPEDIKDIRVVSFGIEPAVILYNGFYTVDGYSTNYPLSYKKDFQNIFYISKDKQISMYKNWGSKAYIFSVGSSKEQYKKGVVVKGDRFNIEALCRLKTDYLISSYEIASPLKKYLVLQSNFIGDEKSWNIYLYKILCF